jgi:hypothetical protein
MRGLKSPKRFFAVFVMACAVAWWYGAWRKPLQIAPPPDFQEINGLPVKLRDLDLGTVWEDDNLQHKLQIENRTDSDIQVIDLHPS